MPQTLNYIVFSRLHTHTINNNRRLRPRIVCLDPLNRSTTWGPYNFALPCGPADIKISRPCKPVNIAPVDIRSAITSGTEPEPQPLPHTHTHIHTYTIRSLLNMSQRSFHFYARFVQYRSGEKADTEGPRKQVRALAFFSPRYWSRGKYFKDVGSVTPQHVVDAVVGERIVRSSL